MLRLTRVLQRHPSLSAKDFDLLHQRYATRLAEHARDQPGVAAFLASTSLPTRLPGPFTRRYDAVTDVWFDPGDPGGGDPGGGDALAAYAVDPVWRDPDLLDEDACVLLTTQEWPAAIDGEPDPRTARMTFLMVRAAGYDPGGFDHHLHEIHEETFVSVPYAQRHCRRYVTARRTTPRPADVPGYDGTVDLWFDSLPRLLSLFANPTYVRTVRADERRFVDVEASQVVLTRETAGWRRPG